MRLLGLNFSKINIEKFSDNLENLKIEANTDFAEVKKVDSKIFKGKEEFITVKFNFSVEYTPDIAKIDLVGNALFSINSKLAKEIIKQWKDKKLPDEFKIPAFNIVLRKSNIKALELAEEMSLPPHLNLPHVRLEDKK